MRRPGRGAARRRRGRRAGEGRDRTRRHDPHDDRPRPEIALRPGRARRPATRCSRSRGCGRRRMPTTRSTFPCAPARSWAWRAWSAPAVPSSPAPCSASTGRSAARYASTGATIAIATPRDAIDHGIFLIPEDRKRSGLVLDSSVNENISLANLRPSPAAADHSHRRRAPQRHRTQRRARHQGTASSTPIVGTLSGGNQQKVVLAKWLSMTPRVVIFDEPTRGIDVGVEVGDLQNDARAGRLGRRRS